MADLLQTARLFEVGTRLQTAASNLMSVAQGGAPDSSALRWAGDFLLRVDWTSGAAAKAGIDGGLAVSATNARPKFYASLVRIGPKFREVGIDSEEQIYSFLKAVYRFLQSGGSGTKDSPPERPNWLVNSCTCSLKASWWISPTMVFPSENPCSRSESSLHEPRRIIYLVRRAMAWGDSFAPVAAAMQRHR